MLFGQTYFALAYFQFNGVIWRCTCLIRCTGFIHLSCLFHLSGHFLGCLAPYGHVVSVYVSTFAVFTTGLVAAATWAYVVLLN